MMISKDLDDDLSVVEGHDASLSFSDDHFY